MFCRCSLYSLLCSKRWHAYECVAQTHIFYTFQLHNMNGLAMHIIQFNSDVRPVHFLAKRQRDTIHCTQLHQRSLSYRQCNTIEFVFISKHTHFVYINLNNMVQLFVSDGNGMQSFVIYTQHIIVILLCFSLRKHDACFVCILSVLQNARHTKIKGKNGKKHIHLNIQLDGNLW